ncbi:MAG: hypothetical protein QM727_04825 [Niabella sp.]
MSKYIRTCIAFFLPALLMLFSPQADAQIFKKKKKKVEPVPVIVDTVPYYKAAMTRQLLHEKVDKEQKSLLNSDGKIDSLFTVSSDQQTNISVTDAALKRVDFVQYEIETNPAIDARLKANYLSGLADILKYVRTNWRRKNINPAYLPHIISTYKKAILAHTDNQSIAPIVKDLPYDVANAALLPDFFKDNPGYKEAEYVLLLKLSNQYPQKTMAALKKYPEAPFADSLIKLTAHKYPEQVYNYAQANNKLSYRIQNIEDDPLVVTLVSIARSENKSGQFYFPFLDNIVNGKTSIKEIDAVKDDPVKYFRLLVQTQISYANRAAKGDTALGFKDLTARLQKKAEDEFVAKINGLHESPDAVRFRSIQPLTAEELYYVAVLTNGLIYTSSYTAGVYPLMMKKAGNKGDELLKKVGFDHYRRFISQAASYNTLKGFLASFTNQQDAHDLMTAFVSRLEKSEGLEDGVDVADSYASIYETLPDVASQMLNNIKLNYDRNVAARDEKGITVYNILYKLFLSADTTNKVNLTEELGIPPVYQVPNSTLKNANGEIVAQVFFYGDRDGRNIFNGFVNMFGGANWKIDSRNKEWVEIKSTKGTPVRIFANRALPEETGADDRAQQALCAYLEENDLMPTITIHRGHSYYAGTTVDYLAPSSKIVFMGSCGGFTLIDSILQKCDDAHIIASKQIGRTSINKPFFLLLTEKLRTGQDIDWIPFWAEFKKRANVAGFEDYIPPFKNLGAIFIKAYKKKIEEDEI